MINVEGCSLKNDDDDEEDCGDDDGDDDNDGDGGGGDNNKNSWPIWSPKFPMLNIHKWF